MEIIPFYNINKHIHDGLFPKSEVAIIMLIEFTIVC